MNDPTAVRINGEATETPSTHPRKFLSEIFENPLLLFSSEYMSLCLQRAYLVFLEKDDLTYLTDTILKILLNENCVTMRHETSSEIMSTVRLIRSHGRLRFLKSMMHDLPYELIGVDLNPKKKTK
jgi:hypothetical protein